MAKKSLPEKTHIDTIDPATLDEVNGGRLLLFGRQAGTAPFGLFPRARRAVFGGCADGSC